MPDNQSKNNNSTIILPYGITPVSPSRTNYVKWIVDHYKELFTAVAASIPVLGVMISFVMYVRNEAFNSYFNINDDWIALSTAKDIYKLLYSGILALTVIFPNIISLWILMFNKKAVQRVKKEWILILISIPLVFIVAIVTKRMNVLDGGTTKQYVLISLLIVALMFLLPLIYIFICDIISLIEVVIKYRSTSFKYLSSKFQFSRLIHPFDNFAKMVDKANQKNIEKSLIPLDNNIAINQSKGIVLLILLFFMIGIIIISNAKGKGKQDAINKKSFSVIELADNLEYDYDDLKDYDDEGNKYLYVPYVKYEFDNAFNSILNDTKSVKDLMIDPPKNKRIINTYTVLAESDDSFLIANSFLVKSKNSPELYIFTDEQTIIDKKDVRIKKMNFIKAPELR